ncbi:MAG: response regulator, partial [Planctomycetota bacterium]
GYCVEPASNGMEAIEKYKSSIDKDTPYDLIILDIMMPDVDGVKVLQIIRKEEQDRGQEAHSRVPVLMLTALKQSWLELEAFDKGCDDFLIKPYAPIDLLLKIEEILKMQRTS